VGKERWKPLSKEGKLQQRVTNTEAQEGGKNGRVEEEKKKN